MKRRGWRYGLLLGGLLLPGIEVCAGEVLGHIDENSQPAPQTQAPAPAAHEDRRITYRVICTPGGEVLPDCEQPVQDLEESAAQPLIATPDLPPDADDLAEQAASVAAPANMQAPKAKISAKPEVGSAKKSKKTAKKAEAVKPSSKNAKPPKTSKASSKNTKNPKAHEAKSAVKNSKKK